MINFLGILIGTAVFLMIGFFHPTVIKAEYYFGTSCWPYFAVVGAGALAQLSLSTFALGIKLVNRASRRGPKSRSGFGMYKYS